MNRQTVKKQQARLRRIARVRAKVRGTADRPRLAVARTLKHIYAQLIDDAAGKTLVAVSDSGLETHGKKPQAIAQELGRALAGQALAKRIEAAVFDRRDKKYHGRVKALAEGARDAGLKF